MTKKPFLEVCRAKTSNFTSFKAKILDIVNLPIIDQSINKVLIERLSAGLLIIVMDHVWAGLRVFTGISFP